MLSHRHQLTRAIRGNLGPILISRRGRQAAATLYLYAQFQFTSRQRRAHGYRKNIVAPRCRKFASSRTQSRDLYRETLFPPLSSFVFFPRSAAGMPCNSRRIIVRAGTQGGAFLVTPVAPRRAHPSPRSRPGGSCPLSAVNTVVLRKNYIVTIMREDRRAVAKGKKKNEIIAAAVFVIFSILSRFALVNMYIAYI